MGVIFVVVVRFRNKTEKDDSANDLELKIKFPEYLCVFLSGALGRFCSFLICYFTKKQMKISIHSKLPS